MAATTQLAPNALPGGRYGSFAGRTALVDPVDGSYTAMHEWVGGSAIEEISDDYQLRLPYGAGGARLYVLTATVPGLTVFLPRADYCGAGGIPTATVINAGAEDFVVHDHDDGFVSTILAGGGESYRLANNETEAGAWIPKSHGTVAIGDLLADRVPLEIELTDSTGRGVGLRTLARAMGYTDDVAYAVHVTIREGVVIGNEAPTVSLNTEEWPAGTTMMLVLEEDARICGCGGRGGRGGDVPPGLLSQAGQAGGAALRMYLDVTLVSRGYIQGGGGGGGGNAYASTTPGGGGGGGAGYDGGAGGASGNHTSGQPFQGGAGHAGSIGAGGAGGSTPASNGGAGGGSGQAGTTAGAAGGAAGNAIEKYNGSVLTILRTGTIDGAEVSL